MWLIDLIVIAVPLIFVLSVALVRQPDRIQFGLYALALGLGMLFAWLVFPWPMVSVWLRTLFPILFALAVLTGYRRIRQPPQPRGKWVTALNVIVNGVLIVFFGGLCWKSLAGYVTPQNPIALASPFREGRFAVGHGGASPFINAHFKVPPQNFALDILGLGSFGRRTKPGASPGDLESYVIYGVSLHSPCDGTVSAAVDGLEDLVPPKADRENLAGNHVMIECLGAEVVLAHMQKGSVAVSPGDQVTIGALLGRVGNSGNTSEPHLHIHAKRGGEPGNSLSGEAVPFTVDGRWLVRGSLLSGQ